MCRDDADVDIVKIAISKKTSENEVIIVEEDTDLLVILTALASTAVENKIYLRRQPKKNEIQLNRLPSSIQRDPSKPQTGVSGGAVSRPPDQWIRLSGTSTTSRIEEK